MNLQFFFGFAGHVERETPCAALQEARWEIKLGGLEKAKEGAANTTPPLASYLATAADHKNDIYICIYIYVYIYMYIYIYVYIYICIYIYMEALHIGYLVRFVRFKHKDYKIFSKAVILKNPCRPSKNIEERMAKACRLIFAACGTSWHSGLIGKYAIASVAFLDHSASFRLRIGVTSGTHIWIKPVVRLMITWAMKQA